MRKSDTSEVSLQDHGTKFNNSGAKHAAGSQHSLKATKAFSAQNQR